MAREAIEQIFHEPKDMFWTGKAMDVLFRGILIDCSNTEQFQAKAVCGVFESGEVKAIQKLNDTHFSFSLFASVGFCNFSIIQFVNVKRTDLSKYQDLTN